MDAVCIEVDWCVKGQCGWRLQRNVLYLTSKHSSCSDYKKSLISQDAGQERFSYYRPHASPYDQICIAGSKINFGVPIISEFYKPWTKSFKSSGKKSHRVEQTVVTSFVRGCLNFKMWAWRHSLELICCTSGGAYRVSPTIGWPIWDMWTRSWWLLE